MLFRTSVKLIFGSKRDEITGEWRKLLHNWFPSPDIIRVIKRMRWAGHVARWKRWERHKKFCSDNLKGRDYLGDFDIDGKIILKLILRKVPRILSFC